MFLRLFLFYELLLNISSFYSLFFYLLYNTFYNFSVFEIFYSVIINLRITKIANQPAFPFLLYFHYSLSADITCWEINAMQSAIEVYTKTNYIQRGKERAREEKRESMP